MNSLLRISPCSLCGHSEATEAFTTTDRLNLAKGQFQIVRCCGCGVMRTLPEMSEEELSHYYPQDYWGGEPTKEWLASTQADKVRALRQCDLKGGRILDVGCGAGFFLSVLDERKWQRYGVEISQQAVEKAARTFGKENIYNGTLLDAEFEAASFDVITFWSALEHMNNPRANLLQAHRLLKVGGSVVIEVPNYASYQAEHFKGDWFALDAPRHRYHFTPQTLGKTLQEAGFEVYYQTFHSRLHNAHALRQSLKKRLWKKSPFGSAAFLLAIPFLKPFDYFLSSRQKGATLTIAARTILEKKSSYLPQKQATEPEPGTLFICLVSKRGMKRTEIKTILLGIALAACGAGLYFIGTRVGSKSVPGENLLFSDGLIDGWTLWHYIGSILIFLAVAVMLGATMAWMRRKSAKEDSQSILSGLG